MVADLVGRPLVDVTSFPTPRDPGAFVAAGAADPACLAEHPVLGKCHGVGVVVPGWSIAARERVLHAPNLGWRDVDLREPLAAAPGLPVQSRTRARPARSRRCGPARDGERGEDIVFVSVSDGVGVGIIVNGELMRGRHNVAGEFGHVPLNIDGPRCACGARGCWEAYVSNLATLSRYFGWPGQRSTRPAPSPLTVDDLIARARGGRCQGARGAAGHRALPGPGLASIVNALDPAHLHRRRDHGGLGSDRARPRGPRGARAQARARATEIVVVPAEHIRACAARRPSWSSRRSRLRQWLSRRRAPRAGAPALGLSQLAHDADQVVRESRCISGTSYFGMWQVTQLPAARARARGAPGLAAGGAARGSSGSARRRPVNREPAADADRGTPRR